MSTSGVSHPSPTTEEDLRHAGHQGRAGRDLHGAGSPGLDAAEPNVLLVCFQDAGQLTPAIRSRYEFLATRAAFTGALGHGMPVTPVAGVRGADLAADDPCEGSGT